MEHLGNRSLFTSHFVLGGKEADRKFTKTKTDVLEALHMWLNFKDNDQGMENYSIVRTRSVDFLEIIELQTFKEITQELHRSYCLEYPYSSRKDFLKHVFEYTIHDLERFLELDLYCHGEVLNENKYCFYTVFMDDAMQFIDFAISGEKEIEYYQQYYRAVLNYLKSFEEEEETTIAARASKNQPPELETPATFEELFYDAAQADPCLRILREIEPPTLDAINNYIGKSKGIFPLWIKVLKEKTPEPLIKHFPNIVYKNLLNQKVKGLNLSKDASEFRKHYKQLENNGVKEDLKRILSQYSHDGKLGKLGF